MKSKIALLSALSLLIILSCSKSSDTASDTDFGVEPNDPETAANLIIESDKIICEFCDGFGAIIETYETQIFVGGLNKIWIFERNGLSISLVQEIGLSGLLELNSITANNDELLLGLNNEFGDGSIHRYRKIGSDWEFEQIYEIGRSLDNFGNDIDLSSDYMVVGASAPWSNSINEGNLDAGSIHIFSRSGEDWNLNQDFNAQDSFADDRFGTDVLIWENIILVGGLSIPLHAYQLENNTWSLLRIEENMVPADLARDVNTVLYYSEQFGLQSFRVNGDGSFEMLNVNPVPIEGGSIQFGGDNISMSNGYALFRFLGGDQVYLLKLTDTTWELETSFNPAMETQFEYSGIKLTPDLALIAGNNRTNSTFYLFFEDY